MCVCVCVSAHMHVCIRVCMYVHVCASVCVCVPRYCLCQYIKNLVVYKCDEFFCSIFCRWQAYLKARVCACVCMCTCVCAHDCVCVCVPRQSVPVYIKTLVVLEMWWVDKHTLKHVCACVCVCMCVCVHMWLYVLNVCVHMCVCECVCVCLGTVCASIY